MTTPTLTLPLSKTKRLDPRVTFTRASTKRYFDYAGILQTAAINQPAFDHDPVSLDSLGLLIEEARTNYCRYNRDLTQVARWSASGCTVAKTATGIDGASNAASTITATGADGSVSQTIAGSTGSATRTTSVYVKRRTGTGTIQITQDNRSNRTNITSLINSTTWTRVSVTQAGVASPVIGFNIATIGDAIDVDYMQHEDASFATSAIETPADADVTRAADVASMAGTNFSSWWNQTEGTFVCEFDYQGATASSFGLAYQVSDGTANNKAGLASYSPSINRAYEFVTSGGASVFDASGQAQNNFSFNEKNKSAFAFKSNDFASSRNGSSPYLDTSGAIPAVNTLNLGGNYGAGQVMCGHISTLIYFPKRLSDTALAILST